MSTKEITSHDISGEVSRKYLYHFFGNDGKPDRVTVVEIYSPKTLFCGMGHAFHGIWDGHITYLCHAPGPIRDCDGNIVGISKITWVPGDKSNPCRF